jgi:ABC-type branched-subunit amino acid transport system substrate-binding protein
MPAYDPESFSKITFANSSEFDQNMWNQFQQSYKEKYKSTPNPSLAYVYDGILLAIEAINECGPDSEAIRTKFKDLKLESVTGKIAFGDLGNRIIEN